MPLDPPTNLVPSALGTHLKTVWIHPCRWPRHWWPRHWGTAAAYHLPITIQITFMVVESLAWKELWLSNCKIMNSKYHYNYTTNIIYIIIIFVYTGWCWKNIIPGIEFDKKSKSSVNFELSSLAWFNWCSFRTVPATKHRLYQWSAVEEYEAIIVCGLWCHLLKWWHL